MEKLKFSVVIPAYNERENLPELFEKIAAVMEQIGEGYEIILIDDGSTDGTDKLVKDFFERYPLKYIRLRRNSGKSAALQAGFDHVEGEIVITLDADLQDDPAEIPRLLEHLEKGYDLVSCWKKRRRDPVSKTLPSRIFNWFVSKMTGVNLHDMNCGFKVYRREVVERIKLYGELHRFIPVLAAWKGFRVSEVPVVHHPRKYGKSKFGMERFLRGFFDFLTVFFITRYRLRPLHLFGSLGLLSSFAGFLILLYLTILWFHGVRPIGNRPLFFLGILLLIVGIQFFTTGFIADMIVSGWFYPQREFYPLEAIYESSILKSEEVPDKESPGEKADK